jgi:hypothetical protein
VREAITIIWRLAVATELVLALRLLLQGLGGVYPALLTGSCLFALQATLLMVSTSQPHNRPVTDGIWKVTEPLVWLVWCWIVLELFSKWTRSYRGIGRFGRFLFGVLISIALIVSLIFFPLEWKALFFAHDFRIYYIFTRVLMATLALFMLLVWLFFRNYPEAVAPNVVRHSHITVTCLGVNALSVLALTLNGLKVIAWVNLVIVAVSAGCFSAWAIFLTRKGEERQSVPTMPIEDVARIEQVNEELLGLMKGFPG